MIVGNGPFVILLPCKRRHRHWWLMESGSASGVIILDHIYYWVLKIQRTGMGMKCERCSCYFGSIHYGQERHFLRSPTNGESCNPMNCCH